MVKSTLENAGQMFGKFIGYNKKKDTRPSDETSELDSVNDDIALLRGAQRHLDLGAQKNYKNKKV